MSDRANNGGIALPDRVDATHNPSLSPFFFGRSGTSGYSDKDKAVPARGEQLYFWSSVSVDETQSYYFVSNIKDSYPSGYSSRILGFSLRRLVSTKRQASE